MRQNSYPYSLEPVTREEMFYGHREELEDVISKITAQSRYSFSITGGSRMGKTSLLRQVERRLHQFSKDEQSFNDFVLIPLYMDMLLEERTPNDFFGKAAYLLHRVLPGATTSLTFSDPAKTLFEDARNLLQTVKAASEEAHMVFISALENLAQAVELADSSLRIVFLIDDLWRLKQPEVSLPLIKHLRYLYTISALDRVIAYIFTGSVYERQLAFAIDSPLQNILSLRELQVFDEEQALALINGPTQGQIRAEVALKIYEETGGHPFLLQGLMSTLCEQGNPAQLTV